MNIQDTNTHGYEDADQATDYPDPHIQTPVEHARLMLQIIDRLSKAGGFSGDELLAVGYLYTDIQRKLDHFTKGNM